jgi:hypothetical protein
LAKAGASVSVLVGKARKLMIKSDELPTFVLLPVVREKKKSVFRRPIV